MDTFTTPMTSVWANDVEASAFYHPFTEAMDARTIQSVRISIEMRFPVGNLRYKAFDQYSADGVTWDAPVDLTDVASADGVVYPSSWTDIKSNARRFVRSGVKAYNSRGTNLNLGFAGLRVESRIG